MSQIVRLPKRLHRDFRIPGVKPVGPVEIDWSNPLAKNLRALILFRDDAYYDLVSGKFLTLTNAPTRGVGVKGQTLDFNGTNQAASLPIDLSNTGAVTIATGFDWSSYANNDDFAFEFTPSFNSNKGFMLDPNSASGNISLGRRLDKYCSGTVTRPSAGYHDYLMKVDRPISSTALSIDGVPQTVTFGANDFAGVGNYDDSTLYLASRGASSLFGTIKYSYFILWDANVSARASAAGISEDPYQLLKPANATIYLIPAAGGGTAHSLTLSESMGASAVNSALWAIAANTPESIAATSTQSASADFAVSASESAAVSSAQSSSGATAVTVSESSALTSAQSAGLQIVASASESVSITDDESVAIVSGLVAVTVSESINATSAQSASQAAAVSVAESANTSSDQTASAAFSTAVAEAVASTDLQSISFALESSISEALVTGSAQASVISIDGAVSESIGATSTQSAAAAFAPSVAFSTAVAESVITAAAYQTSYADSIQAVSVESIGIAGETVSFTITVQRKTTLATHVATATLN